MGEFHCIPNVVSQNSSKRKQFTWSSEPVHKHSGIYFATGALSAMSPPNWLGPVLTVPSLMVPSGRWSSVCLGNTLKYKVKYFKWNDHVVTFFQMLIFNDCFALNKFIIVKQKNKTKLRHCYKYCTSFPYQIIPTICLLFKYCERKYLLNLGTNLLPKSQQDFSPAEPISSVEAQRLAINPTCQ